MTIRRFGVATCSLLLATALPGVVMVAGATPGPIGQAAPDPAPSGSPGVSPTPDQQARWAETLVAAGPSVADPRVAGAPTDTAALAEPVFTVTPATDLARGQMVAVSGTGFPVGTVAVLQCAAGVSPANRCDLSGLRFLRTDSAGAFTTDVEVRRVIDSPAGRLDCAAAAGACEMVAADQSAQVLARHALAFDPTVPLPTPTITVTPATNLLDGQGVTVTGAGFLPDDELSMQQCAATARYCYGNGGQVMTDATGAFTAPLAVRLRVLDADNRLTNCIAVECVIEVASFNDGEYLARTAIGFDPGQPIPPGPEVTVAPSTGLRHNQEIFVSGTGFGPGSYVEIAQCTVTEQRVCADYLGDLEVDGDGTFATTVRVTRLARVFDITEGLADCALITCTLQASSYGEGDDGFPLNAEAPIEFDPALPPPTPPTATATPVTDLPYRTQVAIHGEGFTPNEFVYSEFCIFGEQAGSCPSFGSARADEHGAVDLTIAVTRRAYAYGEVDDELLDCIDPAVECAVSVYGQRSFEQVTIPLTFDPNAAIPPPPTATITPAGSLGWRQVVGLLGTGFPPGPIGISQCGMLQVGDDSFQACDGYAEAEVNDAGQLLTTVTVRRQIGSEFATPVDCATAPTPCELRVGEGGPDDSARIPLQFDPTSQPPPPPVLSVMSGGNLLDGRTVDVTGRGWTPGALVGLTECAAGAGSIADACDITHVFVATADADGAFTVAFTPISVPGTIHGPLDCTVAACVLAAANAQDRSEFTTTPITFDAPELTVRSTTVDEGTNGHDHGHHHVTAATSPTTSPPDEMTDAPVKVTLSEPIGSPTTVEWHTTPGTADEHDFLVRHGRVTIPAGKTTAVIHVKVTPDALDEPNERLSLEVVAARGTTVVDGEASVKIRDDDDPPRVEVRDGLGHEGRENVRAWVVLSAPSARTVVVRWVTHHGTAVSGTDYERSKGDIVFHPGETRRRVRVPLVDDSVRERTESFTVKAHDATDASIRRAEARVTIRDDD